jgi:hypothetical protein
VTGRHRRTLELGAALVAYAGLLIVSIAILRGDAIVGDLPRALVALMPVPAAIAIIAIAIAQFLADDELQQRIRLTALAVSCLGTMLVAFSWGFLEGLGYEPLSGFVIFGILVGLYAVGFMWSARRYR